MIPFFLRFFLQRKKTTIILLHDPKSKHAMNILTVLNKKYNIISLQEYIEMRNNLEREEEINIPRRSLIITFDDGHKNNYEL